MREKLLIPMRYPLSNLLISRNALCAHNSFAQHCFSLFLEKISSTSTGAKMDAMDMICFAAEHYGAETLALIFSEIWLALRHEVV
jgi:hypothetical protein